MVAVFGRRSQRWKAIGSAGKRNCSTTVEPNLQEKLAMSNVAVEKVREAEVTTPIIERTAALANAIRQRAYENFQCRGGGHGHSVEDWLQAEGISFSRWKSSSPGRRRNSSS